MPACNECGSFVTADFARVFGDNADQVFGCTSCMTASEIYEGEATRPEPTHGDD